MCYSFGWFYISKWRAYLCQGHISHRLLIALHERTKYLARIPRPEKLEKNLSSASYRTYQQFIAGLFLRTVVAEQRVGLIVTRYFKLNRYWRSFDDIIFEHSNTVHFNHVHWGNPIDSYNVTLFYTMIKISFCLGFGHTISPHKIDTALLNLALVP